MAKKKTDTDYGSPLLWLLGLGGIGVGLYFLFQKRPGETSVAPIPSLTPPNSLPTMGAIATRVQEVGDLWRMGRLTPEQTYAQLSDLETRIKDLLSAGVGEEATAFEVIGRMDKIRNDVADYVKLQTSPA